MFGPLLFIIFINSMEESCLSSIPYVYAIDSRKNNDHLEAFEKNVVGFSKWTTKYGMTFNTSKTQFLPLRDLFPVLFLSDTECQATSIEKGLKIYITSFLRCNSPTTKKLALYDGVIYKTWRSSYPQQWLPRQNWTYTSDLSVQYWFMHLEYGIYINRPQLTAQFSK